MTRARAAFPVAAIAMVSLAGLAPWPFASVEPFWWSLVCAVALTVAAAALLRPGAGGGTTRLPRVAVIAALAPPLVAVLSLVPMPAALLRAVSPGAVDALGRGGVELGDGLRAPSLFPAASVDALIVASACCVTAWIVARASVDPRSRRLLSGLFLAGGVALAMFGLVQRLVDPDPQRMFWSIEIYEVGTPFGPYVNRNHFGGAMLLFTGVAAGGALTARADRRRGALLASAGVALLCALALLATTSRGAVVGLVVLSGGLLFAMPSRGRLRLGGALAAVAVLLLGGLAVAGLFDDLAGRLFTLYGKWENRFLVQGDALRAATGAPVLGTGAGTFSWVYHAFQSVDGQRYFGDAHSDWVQLAMETGLTGALAVVAVLLALGGALLRCLRSTTPARWHGIGALAGCAGLAAHGFFETNLHIPANALLASVVVGIGYGASLGLQAPEVESR